MTHSKTEVLKMMAINPWFAGLPLAERKAMLAVATWVPVTAGEVVVFTDEAGPTTVAGAAEERERPFGRRELAVMLNGFTLNKLQVERGRHDAAIAAETLGFIKRGVGVSHQCGLVEGRLGAAGDTRADRDVPAAADGVGNP